VLTEEKLDDIGARHERTPRTSLKRLAQETGVSKFSAGTAPQSQKPSSENWCAVSARRNVVPVLFNETINCKKYLGVEKTAFSTPPVICEL
jgi:hypothetical protein